MRFARVLRFAAGVLLAVFTLEFCARLDDYLSYRAPIWRSYDESDLYTRDNIGARGKPWARYKKWQLNSLGFRGPELESGRVRIICMGASETFGLYELPDKEYPRQLERELNDWAGRDSFQVVNVAYPGEEIPTQILRLPEIAEEIRPRVALIYPSPAQYVWLPWLRRDSGTSRENSRVHFEWRLAPNLRELAKRSLPESLQSYLRERRIRQAVRIYGAMDKVPEENVERFRGDLEELIKTLRRFGIEPVLVTHATQFGPVRQVSSASERSALLSWRKFFPMLKEDGFLDMEWRMNGAMRQVAAEQHLTLIDAAREIPPGRQNFADFAHFTTTGAHLMAVQLADGLEPLLCHYEADRGEENLSLVGAGDVPNFRVRGRKP